VIFADMLVGVVAMALGGFLTAVAAFNWDWYFQLPKARWLESWCGRRGVRILFGLVGVALIVLGCAIAMGFGLNRT
jgi:hypothetical protein